METVRVTGSVTPFRGASVMNQPHYFVGIDIASESFMAAIGTAPWQLVVPATEFSNTPAGWSALLAWLQRQSCTPATSIVCLEATGVYGEGLTHFLVAQGYPVAVEPPLKVKRAFKPHGHKTDAVDCQHIAEYACRYLDQLSLWRPRPAVLEHLKVLLTTREQLVEQRTAHRNALTALRRKPLHTALAERLHPHLIQDLTQHIAEVEREIRQLIDQQPPLRHLIHLLMSIPGVGLLLATHILILTECATRSLNHKHMAAHLGICPYEHRSGKSVYRRPASRHYGPAQPRKLLHLAARSVATHKPAFRHYYQRKLAEGKPKPVALNNIANKLLKIICAVLRSRTPYSPNYRSVPPAGLQAA